MPRERVIRGGLLSMLLLSYTCAGLQSKSRMSGTPPLTPEHGAPLRLVAPGRACFYSVKWVERLEVLADEAPTTGASIAHNRLQR